MKWAQYKPILRARVIAMNKARAGDAVAAEINRQARLHQYATDPAYHERMAAIVRENGKRSRGRPRKSQSAEGKDFNEGKSGKEVSL
jgi:hypothetical protein